MNKTLSFLLKLNQQVIQEETANIRSYQQLKHKFKKQCPHLPAEYANTLWDGLIDFSQTQVSDAKQQIRDILNGKSQHQTY